ncbi:unnamed protein product [Eruca vesicaria subsp. sativa]|uniref:Jacalin-type lectin domain-containing protein n=1 Tax=Eruca vesicaria subsp. sativa TaxID=29727 RepID=A0ABC8LP84_ERUVS|nr:unnamed protein product [Eruca vesicaria subsp. sativa]
MNKFNLALEGKKIIGFHGSGGQIVYNIGAYVTWITPTKVEAKGGKGGKEWDDDGYDQQDVTMIHVRGDYGGIQSIQFDYVRNGVLRKGALHGASGGFRMTYEIKYLQGEYLVSVEGYYDEGSRVIQGIQFRTNTRTLEMMGYPKGRKFTVASNGNKIVGFHGYADKRLISIGAYFTTTSCKLECVGIIRKGISWDDGSGYDGIRKVLVYADTTSVKFISFEYEHRGKVIKSHQRRFPAAKELQEFVIDYPNEFITSVEGSFQDNLNYLVIKTSKGRTSPTFGNVSSGTRFVLEKPGNILVGFYGKEEYFLYALGAYYRPLPPPPDTEKLEAQGGDGGDYWDDGSAFDRIRKIFIGRTENAVGFVKFAYVQNNRFSLGDDHGNKTLLSDLEEFTLGNPMEYLTSVEGNYDDKSGVITMLRFNTNIISNFRVFGVGTTSSFLLKKDGHKIVGFYGRSSNMLHQIGVHVLPIL